MKQKLIKQVRRVVLVFVLYISGPAFLLLSNPKRLPLPLLILPFLWLFLVILVSSLAMYKYVFKKPVTRRVQLNLGLISMVPVLLAILQSIHQLSVKDIILVVGLVTVASFYVTRLDLGPM